MRHFFMFKKDYKVKGQGLSKSTKLWIAKVTLLAFFISLILSIFSELIQNSNNLVIAIVILLVFMALNVLSDMVGLAITSCQIENIENSKFDDKLKKKCLLLIKSSDKVSSIMCDVIGDICGILCGVSGTIIVYMMSNSVEIYSLKIFIGAGMSALIAGLTVFFKAISKNFAVNNAQKIVKKIGNFLLKISKN